MPIRPPTHRAAGQARRAALLDAAIEVIAESGVSGTTHRAVATRAGVPLSTTSYFFASLDELIAAAMELVATRLLDRIEAARTQLADQDIALDAKLDLFADMLYGLPPRELAAELEIYVHCRHQPALRDVAQRMIGGFEQSTATVLKSLGATDPQPGSRAIVALVDGFILQRFAWPRGELDREALREALGTLVRAYIPE